MNPTNRPTSVSLYFSHGSSDKEYHAQIVPKDGGFLVQFQYGRRGANLTSGCKTSTPVTFEAACNLLSQITREKQAKGYTFGETGVAYQGTENAGRVSGVLPQLLNAIDESQAFALTHDPLWCAQQKHDGDRRLVRIEGAAITGINRKGLTVALPASIEQAARALHSGSGLVLDGEIIGDKLHAFDVLVHDGASTTNLPLSARLLLLYQLNVSGAIIAAQTHRTTQEKVDAVKTLRRTGAEGIVFKRLDRPYTVGRPASGGDALKLKFVATASIRVRGVNAVKRSVAMELKDDTGAWIDVGSVTIPANVAVPPAGTMLEIQYLYAFRGGAIYQSVFKGLRTDIEENDCTTSQLQYKGESNPMAAA